MKVVGIIQARFASERLHGKVLAPLVTQPLLSVIVRRLRDASLDELWLATSTAPSDNLTALWGETLGLRIFRGSERDVLSRFASITRTAEPDWVLRLTADDPFVDSAVVEALVNQAVSASPRVAVIAEAPLARRLPLGYAPQIARGSAILRAESEVPPDQFVHRSHVLSWFYETGEAEALSIPEGWPLRPQWRWTVDTALDLEMAERCFRLFGKDWPVLSYPEMVNVLDSVPEVVNLNVRERQKEIAEG